jgi:triacylglycerol lipase
MAQTFESREQTAHAATTTSGVETFGGLATLHRYLSTLNGKPPNRSLIRGLIDSANAHERPLMLRLLRASTITKSQVPTPGSGRALARADRSAEFEQLADKAHHGEEVLPDDAASYTYLMVPGLGTEHYPFYMDDIEQMFEDKELDYEIMDIDTDAGAEQNAKQIRDRILELAADGKQVIPIGHSKGGVDATLAMAMFPELEPHVHALIAMQTPYGGTPIASDVANNPALVDVVSKAIVGLYNGDPRSLTDLSYETRRQAIAKHPYRADRIPTVSFATQHAAFGSALRLSEDYMTQLYGLASDGLVPTDSAIVPGSEAVYARGDHAVGAFKPPIASGGDHIPRDTVQALITIALGRAREMAGGGTRRD